MPHSDSPKPLVCKRPFEAEGTNQALEQAPALEALRFTENGFQRFRDKIP